MSKRWQKVEINYLKKHAGSKSLGELAERFKTDPETVEAKLRELQLAAGGSGDAEAAAMKAFEQGLAAFQGKKWQAAAERFDEVAAGADGSLAARARQFATEARNRGAEADDGDPYLLAVMAKNRGEYAAARKLCRNRDDDARFVYLDAAVQSLQGDQEGSAERLARAIELDSRNRVHALHDPDFEPLRRSAEHSRLFAS